MMILFICGLIKNIIDVMDEEKNLLGFKKNLWWIYRVLLEKYPLHNCFKA